MKTGVSFFAVFGALTHRLGTILRCAIAVAPLVALALLITPAHAQLWDETSNGGGDAGKLPSELQITIGTGALTTIGGTIVNPDVDIDMYCIRITDEATFSATFDEAKDPFKRFALWLFDSTGRPVAHAKDAGILPYHVRIDSTHVLSNGIYFLAIGVRTFDPRSLPNTPLFAPIASGQTGGIPFSAPVGVWAGTGCCGDGPYAIKLTGAEYHMPPTNGGGGTGPCWTYTSKLDFSQGFLFNLSIYTDPATGDQCLKLDDPVKAWPFVAAPISVQGANSPNSREGAVMRIAAMNLPTYGLNEGDVLGEYISRPTPSYGNPSRTTVDPYGNIWITNRFDDIDPGNPSKINALDHSGTNNPSSVLQGSVTRVGLVLGGTHWDILGNKPDPTNTSPYLKGPFQYCTCEDRPPYDGYIKTSVGYPHTTGALNADYHNTKLPWPSSGLTSGVSTAQDECITAWTRVNASGTRHVSIDRNNDIWVGGTGDNQFEKLDGATAQISTPSTLFVGTGTSGGYGGLVDPNNVLWSSGYSEPGGMLRFDIGATTQANLNFKWVYGIALDPDTCHVWGHDRLSQEFREFLSNGQTTFQNPLAKTYATGGTDGSGIVVHNGWVWGGNNNGANPGSVRRHTTSPGAPSLSVPLSLGTINGVAPHGLTVDVNGKIWTYNFVTHNTMRIDPNLPVANTGKVDLAVDLGSNAYPYTYSDSSGREHLVGSAPQGSWTFIHDGGIAGSKWGTLTWSSIGTPGTYVLARVRAYDPLPSGLALPSGNWTNVTSGVPFPTVIGRYLQVQITLVRPASCNGGGDIKLCSLSICKEPGCYVKLGEILCPTTASPSGLTINATVTNNGTATVKKVRITPTVGSPVSFTPNTVNVTIPPGKSANIQTKAFGWTKGQQFCFNITLVDENNQDCCSNDEQHPLCITPSCDCLQVPNATASVKCNLLTGGFTYKFSFDNLTPSKIYHVYLDPPPGITFDPNYIQFPNGIAPGASSGPITIKIKGASLGQTIPFLLSIHYLYLGECCSRDLTVTMPKSCFDDPIGPGGCCPSEWKSTLSAFSPGWPAHPKLTLSISNPTDQPRAFDWEANEAEVGGAFTAELPLGSIMPFAGTTPVIPPGGSFDVVLSVPSGLVGPNQRAGVRAAVFDHDSGEPFASSVGQVLGSLEFDMGDHLAKARVRAVSEGVLPAPVGVPTMATFEITNDGPVSELFEWQVLATSYYVSIAGIEAGVPKTGSVPIGAGQTATVQVPLTVLHDPGTAMPLAVIRTRPSGWYPPHQIGASVSFRSGAACPADFNADNVVDDADFPTFVQAYDLLACSDSSMPIGCPADLNQDGIVDDADFNVFVQAYNIQLCP